MKLQTTRSKLIDTYLDTHKDAVTDEFVKVVYGGDSHKLSVYRIPIKLLIYNIRNGRFGAELLEKEKELKRKLNPLDPGDATIIQNILLTQNELETEILKEDLRQKGQTDPGIITFDGAVINANRRMAILSVLFLDTSESKYSYLRVGRLPQGVDETDLWRIEAGLQFGKDFRLQYGGVNELLKLREGEKQNLKPKDISVALMGRYSPKKVEEKLEILKLIDSYLEFIGKPREYYRIQEERDLEKFNSLQSNVVTPLLRKHKKAKTDIAKFIAIAFAVTAKTDLRHWDIRDLRKIALNARASKELFKIFPARSPSKISVFKIAPEMLKETFTTSQEIVKDQEEGGKPEKLLRKALSAIDSINPRNIKLKEPSAIELLKSIISKISQLQKASKK